MLLDIFLNIWATPENIISLILRIALTAGLCLIFAAWGEKWWKSLIPFYGTYLLYRHTWVRGRWLFILQILLDMAGAWCAHTLSRSLVGGLLETIQFYARTGEFAVDISVRQLLLWLMVWAVCAFCVFLLTRITYLKICGSLGLESGVLKVGTFLFPQMFLLIDYVCWRKKSRHLSKT